MDRLLFGDNQFFGVNHMSEEKARAQAMRFQSLDAVIDVLDSAYDEGIRTFMCTTHDRIASICDHVRAHPGRYDDFSFYPCMPYAHKYANAVTEQRHARRGEAVPSRRRAAGRRDPGRGLRRKKDIDGITTLLVDAEMKMFGGLRTPVIFLQNMVVDLLLGLGFKRRVPGLRGARARPLRRRAGLHHHEPAGAPAVLDELAIENPIVCANINKIGFRMCGGAEAYEARAARAPVPRRGDVGLRLGRDPGPTRRSSGSARSRTSSRSSSAHQAGETSRAPGSWSSEHWGERN